MTGVVHGIDRYTQDHLCGQVPGMGTDSRQPAMPITCPLCLVALDVQALTDSVVGCLSNASHLPEWMQVPALGRDTRPILELVARAVLTSDWLTDHDTEVTARANAEAWDEAAQLIEAETQAERQRLGAACDKAGLLGNWVGAFREAAKMLRSRADQMNQRE